MTRMYRVTARRGRGECQEVRAPRTCPAVRMRRPPAPQGKPSAFLLRPSSPSPLPCRKGRGEAGDRWSRGRGAEGGAATSPAPLPSLKGQHTSVWRQLWVGRGSSQGTGANVGYGGGVTSWELADHGSVRSPAPAPGRAGALGSARPAAPARCSGSGARPELKVHR